MSEEYVLPEPIVEEFDTEQEALDYIETQKLAGEADGLEPLQANFETQEEIDEWVSEQRTGAQQNGKDVLKYYIAYWKGVLRYVLILIGFPIPIPE